MNILNPHYLFIKSLIKPLENYGALCMQQNENFLRLDSFFMEEQELVMHKLIIKTYTPPKFWS